MQTSADRSGTLLAGAAVLLGAWGWPLLARAGPAFQAVGEVTVGGTDNARSAPDQPVPGAPPKTPDGFLVLSPGVVLGARSARVIQRLAYTYSLSLYYAQSSADTSSNRLEYLGFFDVSPRLALVLASTVTTSTPYSGSLLATPGTSELSSAPAGTGVVLGAKADEELSYDVSADWRAWEGTSAGVATALTGPSNQRTVDLGERAGVERMFEADALGVEARGDYSIFSGGVANNGAPLGAQRQLVVTGVGRWRHDWGQYVTSSVEAGAVRVERLGSGRGFFQPTARGALGYANDAGTAELSVAHRVTTNPMLGQSLLVDEAELRGAIPLTSQRELFLGASVGYQHARPIAEDATLAPRLDVALADVRVGWQATSALAIAVRYQYVHQWSDAVAAQLPLTFARNSVMATATLRLPPDLEMPRPYRAPLRVDKKDEQRDGLDPAAQQ